MLRSSAPAADSSDLELHTDSSSSGGSPRASSSSSSSEFHAAARFSAFAEPQDDEPLESDMTASHVSIKPNLKLMSNSERGKYYRRKRKLYAAELSASVSKLRRQVQSLVTAQQLRSELVVGHRQTALGSLAKLVREYCTQFEFGTPVAITPLPMAFPGVRTPQQQQQLARVATASSQQSRFLHAAMEEDVGFGEFAGIALLLDQWERYSMYHAALRFELKSLDVVAGAGDDDDDSDEPVLPVIVVRADLHVRYSLETIKQVFPHLLDDHELVQELIGLEVTYPCVNHFYFSADGKITRYNPEVDFMVALAAKIRSMTGVAHVLSRALIAKDHMIGVIDDEDDDEIKLTDSRDRALDSQPQFDYDDPVDSSRQAAPAAPQRENRRAKSRASEKQPLSPLATFQSASRFDLDFILS